MRKVLLDQLDRIDIQPCVGQDPADDPADDFSYPDDLERKPKNDGGAVSIEEAAQLYRESGDIKGAALGELIFRSHPSRHRGFQANILLQPERPYICGAD